MTSSFRSGGSVIRRYQYVAGQAAEPYQAPEADEPAEEANPAETAAELIAAARAEAERLGQAAAEQIERARQQAEAQAYQAGFAAGQRDGVQAAEAATEDAVARFCQLVESMIAERKRLILAAEGELVELAVATAEKVVGDLASSCSGTILQLAQQGVDLLGCPDTYEVHVSLEDAAQLTPLLAEMRGQRMWQLVPDSRVAPGGCTVVHGAALVEVDPHAQLKLVRQAFAGLAQEMDSSVAGATLAARASEAA